MFNGTWTDAGGRQEPVRVAVEAQGLRVERLGAQGELWPYAQIRQGKKRRGQPVRFEWEPGGASASIWLTDVAILQALQQHAAPEWRRKFDDPSARQAQWKRVLVASVAAIAVLGLVYTLALPLLADAVTQVIPVSWEELLGNAVANDLAPEKERCTDPELLALVDGLVQRLAKASGEQRYRFQTAVHDAPTVNAFAAPGGHLVVARGLVRRMRTPEELAGVLAHELEHVRQRHSTRALVRELSVKVLVGLLVGDAAALGGAIDLASNLNQLRFSRGDESSADREGLVNLTRAGMAAHHMANALARLKEEDEAFVPGALSLLSTHPELDQRISELRAREGELPVQVAPVTLSVPWPEMRQRCR